MAEVEKNEKIRLDEWATEITADKVEVESVFAVGTAYSAIVEAAREIDVDMVILATHGRKGVSHLVFGSTAEKVVRLAPCPVLTIKYPEHEFVKA
jgi:nucleotide-binding universal stress UspA family protein